MCFFKIYEANVSKIFLEKILHKWLKDKTLIYNIQILRPIPLDIFSTSYSMNFLDLKDDVKLIITKNLLNDLKIRTILSKHDDLQKLLFGEIVFDDDFCKILKLQNDVKEMMILKMLKNIRF